MQLCTAGIVSGCGGMCDKNRTEEDIQSESYSLHGTDIQSAAGASVCVTDVLFPRRRNDDGTNKYVSSERLCGSPDGKDRRKIC